MRSVRGFARRPCRRRRPTRGPPPRRTGPASADRIPEHRSPPEAPHRRSRSTCRPAGPPPVRLRKGRHTTGRVWPVATTRTRGRRRHPGQEPEPQPAERARTVKQFLTYVASGPFQPAVALALGLGDDVYRGFASSLQAKRDLLCDGLSAAGLEVARPAGTYFVIADAAPLGASDALEFCRQMPDLCGVVGVPVSVFCDDKDAARTLV